MTTSDAKALPSGARAIPIQGVAARLVAYMDASLAVPTATSFRDVPVARLMAERAALNAALAPRRLSYTHFIAYAVVQAAVVHPVMTSYFQDLDGRPQRIEPARVGLGIAVDTEQRDGSPFLMVPVIHAADEVSFAEFTAAYDDLVQRARSGRLTADDLVGGTITLTNPGTMGTTASVPRLMAGQGSIIATGAIRGGAGERLMTISSTYDHRIIQGAVSGRFLHTLEEFLEGADGFYEAVAESVSPAGSVGAAAASAIFAEAGTRVTSSRPQPATATPALTSSPTSNEVAGAV
ncbi:MAG: 2-oxo acid dehydrogenase subunit E2, partial [Candidatus Limnocylindrales bacterium]